MILNPPEWLSAPEILLDWIEEVECRDAFPHCIPSDNSQDELKKLLEFESFPENEPQLEKINFGRIRYYNLRSEEKIALVHALRGELQPIAKYMQIGNVTSDFIKIVGLAFEQNFFHAPGAIKKSNDPNVFQGSVLASYYTFKFIISAAYPSKSKGLMTKKAINLVAIKYKISCASVQRMLENPMRYEKRSQRDRLLGSILVSKSVD